MSILVIGANGGVGSKLVSQLNEEHVDFTAGVRKEDQVKELENKGIKACLLYTSPSPRDKRQSRMPSSA